MYPYISFKDFKHNGFVFSSDKTLSAIRNVSLDYINKRKYDKNTKWVIFEIDTDIGEINKLYKDPNYINGYYYLGGLSNGILSLQYSFFSILLKL